MGLHFRKTPVTREQQAIAHLMRDVEHAWKDAKSVYRKATSCENDPTPLGCDFHIGMHSIYPSKFFLRVKSEMGSTFTVRTW